MIIAGAGIGGLTAALALHQQGIDVVVCEAVREVQPLGVGINVLPHAMAVFDGLGLTDRIAELGVRTAELCYVNRFGQEIWAEPRGLEGGYPVPQVSLHRGRFQLELLAIARERLGDDAVRTGRRLDRFAMDGPNRVRATFDDRLGGDIEETGDILVGADGIHSTVRRHFYPDEGPPHWSGNILWRAVSHAPAFRTGRSMIQGGTRRHKFVAYPITPPDAGGLCTINWIAEMDRTATGLADREDWNRIGDKADFAAAFDEWNWDWCDVPAIIAAADVVYEFPMVDRDPLPRWTFDRVTLLGDAAHPMYPIGSNGASQAVLDARALADALADSPTDVDAALAAYETARRPPTAAIVEANRADGPDIVLDWAEDRAPQGFRHASDVFAPGELEDLAASYKAVAGFSKEAVNKGR